MSTSAARRPVRSDGVTSAARRFVLAQATTELREHRLLREIAARQVRDESGTYASVHRLCDMSRVGGADPVDTLRAAVLARPGFYEAFKYQSGR